MTVFAIFWMKRFFCQSRRHRVWTPSRGESWLADKCAGGVLRRRDWLDTFDEAGSLQLRLSRLAKRWRCCGVQVKGTRKKKNRKHPGSKQEVQWKRGILFVRQNLKSEAFFKGKKSVSKRNTFGVSEESAVVSTIALYSCVFSTINKEWKHWNEVSATFLNLCHVPLPFI